MTKLEEALTRASANINWENWEVEHVPPRKDVEYMKVTEVLYSRLDWIAEIIKLERPDDEESLETIAMVQEVIQAIESNI